MHGTSTARTDRLAEHVQSVRAHEIVHVARRNEAPNLVLQVDALGLRPIRKVLLRNVRDAGRVPVQTRIEPLGHDFTPELNGLGAESLLYGKWTPKP